MSSIPPPGHAGLIQAHGAQRQATEARAKETSSQAQRLGDTFSEKLKEVIENDDLDSQVFADGEGAGGALMLGLGLVSLVVVAGLGGYSYRRLRAVS